MKAGDALPLSILVACALLLLLRCTLAVVGEVLQLRREHLKDVACEANLHRIVCGVEVRIHRLTIAPTTAVDGGHTTCHAKKMHLIRKWLHHLQQDIIVWDGLHKVHETLLHVKSVSSVGGTLMQKEVLAHHDGQHHQPMRTSQRWWRRRG